MFDEPNAVFPFFVRPDGKVGIGTLNPSDKLSIIAATANSNSGISLANSSGADRVKIRENSPNGGYLVLVNSNNDANVLLVGSGSSYINSGNVGIGTANPSEKLHVEGNIMVSGNINAKYQDIAEWVPASHPMPVGTVVVLDSTRSKRKHPRLRPFSDERQTGAGNALGSCRDRRRKVPSARNSDW